MTRSRTMLGLWAVAATLVASTVTASAAAADPGATIRHEGSPTAVADSYIVVLRDTATLRDRGVPALARQLISRHSGTLGYTYQSALHGFSVTVSAANARRIAADPAVEYVEQNQRVTADATQTPTPSWGLDRIDQRDLPLNNSYTYPTTATNVRAYIIDTGIRLTHNDFGGRAVSGRDTVDNDNDATDCNGHGTHVAGTVGGTAYGVAKGVQLVGVRVLNCQGSGTNAGVIAGVDWVTANAVKPAVANMSLGGGADSSLDTAVRNSINSGITYALAAGNENTNACNRSPARTAEAITVASSTRTDARSSFSNYGTCVDIFAPGSDITSAWYTSNTATNTISGTSMAAPHVAGAAALYLSTNTGATPTQVRDNLVNTATLNKITSPGTGSPNRLLYVGAAAGNVVTVTNPGSRTSTVGTATSLQISASSSGGGALTYSASGLPTGLSISSSTGLISGTPSTAGTFTTTVTATDSTSASGSTTFTWTVNGTGGGCTSPGQKLGNPGFESSTAAPWTASSGVIDSSTGQPARSGAKKAWLNGYGTTRTDTLSQTVTVPAGCSTATFSFWLRITSAETSTTTAYDKLTVQVGSTTLATYSNLNKNSTYTQKTFSLAGYAGQTVTLKFTGVEDSTLATSFVIDDTALDVS